MTLPLTFRITKSRSHFENYIYPAIGKKDATQVTDDDVIDLLDPIRRAGSYRQRNAVRTTLLGLFNWVRDKEKNRTIKHLWGMRNPVRDVSVLSKKDVSGWKDRSKEPLPPKVLGVVTKRLYEKRTEPYEAALLLQLLTGQQLSFAAITKAGNPLHQGFVNQQLAPCPCVEKRVRP